jgi:hypothetical protein
MSLLKHLLLRALENPRQGRYRHDEHRYYYGDSGHHKHPHVDPAHIILLLTRRLSAGGGKLLLWVLAGLAVLLIVIAIGIVAALIPFFTQGFDYVNQNGLKGVMEALTSIVRQVWERSGK